MVKYESQHANRAKLRNFNKSVEEHKLLISSISSENQRLLDRFHSDIAIWEASFKAHNEGQETLNAAFLEEQKTSHDSAKVLKARWIAGEPKAIVQHANMVLNASNYSHLLQSKFDLAYLNDRKLVLVEFHLPTPDAIPLTKTSRYVQTTQEFKETYISEKEKRDLYDDICYQICLRTIHELFEADTHGHIDKIVFNGIVEYVDKSTGSTVSAVTMSLMVDRPEFTQLKLSHVEPKACFKSLKGVSASSLSGLVAIPPIMNLEKSDKRFIEARSVDLGNDGATNLASMDWQDFEHLIREIFEKEFSSRGGEVKVTQSSRDGGVDAVAFDPDPIIGGKIIIQAKRYTNTVGVSAVRDLYGTTMSEGATKGILVTTSDYGPDAYKFATGKPITLLSGSNLLHLLQKHGFHAKIDLQAARKEAGLSQTR